MQKTPRELSDGIPFVLSVDSSGALFAGFSVLSGYTYTWRGVYFTTNGGTSWSYAGLDQVPIRQLISFGDTTYAVTYADGVYKLSRSTPLAVREDSRIPLTFTLYQNYPNPFNPATVISYHLPAGEAGLPVVSKVTLMIYDVLGCEVATLVNEEQSAGWKEVQWNATGFSSGIYFYRLQAGSFSQAKKLILLR